ncbi:lipopolysaccharide biosynthesis protein [Alteromonas sp. ASW11-36]|uniref:Lipopolysaccharide biosynthesis protein n=1 Tax=Alteromonas arenosi TaxID=3055817 RepID=A0ABT7SYX6_9ALTE|nr:lipopolysaccharide biosynthesis protein [Alteromonas sp. ASW11-36]MDM7861401.1 lipopolysaccharide biosynthesis protein [Alteromonas sp. ASW11-36]
MTESTNNQKTTNKNASWSVFNQVASYATSLIFTAILARIVAPEDFGIFAMAMTVSAFFVIFADGGMVWSIIQRQNISNAEIANLRWLNGGLGLLMTVLAVVVSPFVAAFYGYPEITWVLAILGVNFFLAGVSTPSIMWLKRQQRFKAIALIDIFATLAAGSIAVVSAFQGAGVWALVVQAVSKVLIQGVLVTVVARCPAGWFSRQVDMKNLTLFGSSLIAFGAVNYFARNLDNVLIGAYIDAESLAYYTRAYFLMTLPSMLTTGALSGLLVSILSRLQEQPDQLQKQYAHTLRFLFIICAPIAIYFLLFPQDPIALLYGEQWADVVPLLQVLSLACLTQPIHNTMGWLFTAAGKAGNMLRWGIGASIALSLSFAVGVQYGAIGVAVAYSLIMGIGLTIGAVWFAHHSANIRFIDTCQQLVLPMMITGLTIALSYLLSQWLAFTTEYLWLAILYHGSLIVGIYVVLLAACYRGQLRRILQVAV